MSLRHVCTDINEFENESNKHLFVPSSAFPILNSGLMARVEISLCLIESRIQKSNNFEKDDDELHFGYFERRVYKVIMWFTAPEIQLCRSSYNKTMRPIDIIQWFSNCETIFRTAKLKFTRSTK